MTPGVGAPVAVKHRQGIILVVRGGPSFVERNELGAVRATDSDLWLEYALFSGRRAFVARSHIYKEHGNTPVAPLTPGSNLDFDTRILACAWFLRCVPCHLDILPEMTVRLALPSPVRTSVVASPRAAHVHTWPFLRVLQAERDTQRGRAPPWIQCRINEMVSNGPDRRSDPFAWIGLVVRASCRWRLQIVVRVGRDRCGTVRDEHAGNVFLKRILFPFQSFPRAAARSEDLGNQGGEQQVTLHVFPPRPHTAE